MGFYGNITNTSRTQFQFDRTFPNRKVMDQFIGTDGVYIGRFVLVEYDKALAADWCTTAYLRSDEQGVKHFYGSPQLSSNSEYLYSVGNIVAGKYIRIPATFKDTDGTIISYNKDDESSDKDIIFEILSTSVNGQPPKVKAISTSNQSENDYINNYNIDREVYGGGRGYDSTVWQKVYADGKETYVMIAELNSVVPTFNVSADAPTMSPIAPHFDADSTNIYYRVHWQPAWGLRVKAAAPSITVKPIRDNGTTITGTDIVMSSTTAKHLPTDESTFWTRSAYDTSTGLKKDFYYQPAVNQETLKTSGEWRDYAGLITDNMKFPAAIYYNKAGFNPAIITYSDKDVVDKIAIEPTGLSGHRYNVHDKTGATSPQIDTQELSIMLPSIGNSVAQMWDLIYGNEELNGSNKRNTYVTWTEGSIVPNVSGLRLVTRTASGYGYEPKQAETLAGCINSVHDLMGMLIQKKNVNLSSVTSAMVEEWGTDYIYYLPNESRYYRAHKTYTYNDNFTSFNKKDRFINIDSYTDWPAEGYYYKDYAESNPYPAEGNLPYPNIIKGKKYEADKVYYKTVTVGSPVGEFVGGAFEPYKFFILERDVESKDENGNTIIVDAYRTSLDKTFNSSSRYLSVSHAELPIGSRFWSSEETYYTTTFNPVSNPTEKEFENDELFIKDEFEKYKRPDKSLGMSSEETYYKPSNFEPVDTLDSRKQHFMVKVKVEGNNYYVEKEEFTVAPNVNKDNFADDVYYYKDAEGKPVRATSYQSGVTYYTRKVILELQEGRIEIAPSNITEVFLLDVNSTPSVDGVSGGVYCQYRPKAYEGYDEYFRITSENCKGLTSNLVVLYVTTDLKIYEPNLYYYLEENKQNPLYGSYIFDSNAKPTEGRKYYASDSIKVTDEVVVGPKPVYEPFKFYYTNTNSPTNDTSFILSTSKTTQSGKYYWKKNGVYVKADTTGVYPVGMEWNINVPSAPSGVTLSGRTEKWELQELEGFARHFNTIHGLILRVCSMLEQKDDLVRDYDTVQGTINRMKDLLIQFGELYSNQILVTDQYGRITSTTFSDDNWIYTNYSNDSAITINHQYIGTESTKAKTLTVSGEPSNKTIPFGGTFTSPSFSLRTDAMGHANEFSTSSTTITMPTLSLTPDTSGNVVTGITMEFNGTKTLATFKEAKENVGNLTLADYTTPAENVTGITASDSIISAFTKINTLLAGYDTSTTAAVNNYITSVTQTNGKVTATTAATTTITQLGTITVGTWDSTIAANRVTTNTIVDGAVTNAKVASGLDASKLTTGTLPIARIADEAITNAKLASDISASKLTTGTLPIARIADGAITSAKIADGTIATGDIADGAITDAKINSVSASKVSGELSTCNIPALNMSKITGGNLVGSRVVLTGYSTQASGSVAATDSVNVAIAKLEARIAALEP